MQRSIRPLSHAAALLAVTGLGGCGAIAGRMTEAHGVTTAEANRPSLIAARGALQDGETATALGIAHGVLVGDPTNVPALVAAGDADNQIGNRRLAEKEYRQAIQFDPSYVPARLGLGKLKMRDDIKGAEAEFRAVVLNAPHDAAALTDLGVAMDLQGRHKEAQAAYTAAMAANPDLTSTRVDMGLSLALSGNPTDGEAMLRDATEAGPVPAKVRADYAVAQVVAGHTQEAQETLQADLSADEAKASVLAMAELAPSDIKPASAPAVMSAPPPAAATVAAPAVASKPAIAAAKSGATDSNKK